MEKVIKMNPQEKDSKFEDPIFKLIEVYPQNLSNLPSQQWKGKKSHQRFANRIRDCMDIERGHPLSVFDVAQYYRVSPAYMFRILFPRQPLPQGPILGTSLDQKGPKETERDI